MRHWAGRAAPATAWDMRTHVPRRTRGRFRSHRRASRSHTARCAFCTAHQIASMYALRANSSGTSSWARARPRHVAGAASYFMPRQLIRLARRRRPARLPPNYRASTGEPCKPIFATLDTRTAGWLVLARLDLGMQAHLSHPPSVPRSAHRADHRQRRFHSNRRSQLAAEARPTRARRRQMGADGANHSADLVDEFRDLRLTSRRISV